ncbi:MAG: response regulator transcription factor [Kofleriaceae bacterium]|nr:response regulator transcription factor [Kofleriaceae bacterium]MCL4223163.1 hypothetical protein [Myxococcales bacterium]
MGQDELTPRELDVLELLALGLSYQAVAQTLGVTANTVRTHVRAIYAKLGVNSKTAAVITGVIRGLIDIEGRAHGREAGRR